MADVTFDAEFVEQQDWAYLTKVLNFPEISAAAIMGSWTNESGRTGTTPDPTSIEGIFDEPLTIGPRKQNAMSNWQTYATTYLARFINEWYLGEDGKYYPGVGMWAMTGRKVTQLFKKAESLGQNWYDLEPQLILFKETYVDGALDSGRQNMMNSLKQGSEDISTLTDYAYGLVAYGSPFHQASAVDSAQRIYAKHKGSNYTYTGGSSNNKCEEFVQKALSYKGTTEAQWASSHPKWYEPRLWCAEFVSACGEEVDILGKVFDGDNSGYNVGMSVEKYGGKVHTESNYNPQRGDLILFIYGRKSIKNGSDHIGIVTEYKDDKVYTIEGNYCHTYTVDTGVYWRTSDYLGAFCHPDWSKVGGSFTTGSAVGGISGDLFSNLNTREDAILREAAYLETVYDKKDKKKILEYKASEKPTDIKLSLINYTELFQAFWKAGVPSMGVSSSGDATGSYDYSNLDPKIRECIEFLVGKGLNNAAACGICGNIKHESGFRTEAVGDGGTSFGICQWHEGRGANMKQMAGSNWANNLSGQLDFLWYELENNYPGLVNYLKSVDNTVDGCKQAADKFVRLFERPSDVDNKSIERQNSAVEYFNQITQVVTSSSSTGGKWTKTVNLANCSQKRKTIIEAAQKEVAAGTPYVWGGSQPGVGLDCSGLTMYCYSLVGIELGHNDMYQYNAAPHVLPVSEASIGDILWMSGHVGIYVGDGNTIEEYTSGAPCSFLEGGAGKFSNALHWDI